MATRWTWTAAATVIAVGAFAPWLRSGTMRRSSFEVFDMLDRLGFATDGPFAAVVRAWPLVPLLVTVAVVARWFQRVAVAVAVALPTGLVVVTVATGVLTAPDAKVLGTEWGVATTLVGGIALLATSAVDGLSLATGRAR